MSSLGVKLQDSCPDSHRLAKVLCPTSSQAAKCINKYIVILEKSRKLLDEGTPPEYLGHRNPVLVEGGYDPTDSEGSLSLSSVNSVCMDSSFEE